MSGPQRGFTHWFHLQGQASSSGGKGGVGMGWPETVQTPPTGRKTGVDGWGHSGPAPHPPACPPAT